MKLKFIICTLVSLFNITECFADQISTNLSTGYEKITSPLVRIDIDSPLILVDGRSKLAGHYYQLNLNGVKNWELDNDVGIDLSVNAYVKEAPKAEDLNFSTLSVDASWRKSFGKLTIGLGPSGQRIWIVNHPFRDSISLQSDLTYVNSNGNFTNVYLALSKSKYVDEFDFFNSKTITASLTHHIKNVGLGFSALDLQFNASREKNTEDFDDLSNVAYYARLSVDRELFGLTWSAGASITKSYFDAPFFEGFEKRRDAYVSYELGVERKISDKLHLNLDLNVAKNSSNLALFQSDYRAVNLTLNYTY